MLLTREQLIKMAVDDYFIGLNKHDVPLATSGMGENCTMWFSAAKYRYEGIAANIVHLTEFTENFETVNFHNFVNIVDVDTQAIATRFHVDLIDHKGKLLSMSNSNWFQFNEDGKIEDILIYNAAPLKEGFEAGSSV